MRPASAIVEVVEARTVNERVWNRTETVEEVDPRTGLVVLHERAARVTEVGDFLNYKDSEGRWVPSQPRWVEEAGVFRAFGVGYQLTAAATVGELLRYLPADEDREVLLRPNGLYLLEGEARTPVRSVASNAAGVLSKTDATRLLYPNALGAGVDLELELTASGFHQNVIIRSALDLPDAPSASLLLETEINLDDLAGVDGRAIAAGGATMSKESATDAAADSHEDSLAFVRTEGGETRESWAFGASRVFTTANGAAKEAAVAKKKLARHGGAYLQETLPRAVLTDAVAKGELPLVWDFVTIQNPISQTTVWRGGYTYWVKNCTVSHTTTPITLTIEPGATIKREPGTTFAISTNAKLLAIGEPYASVTFTSAGDFNCGEVSGTMNPTGVPTDLVQILALSSGGSTFRYCKFTRASSRLLYLASGQVSSIENSVFVTGGAGVSAIVGNSMTGSAFWTLKNNLFVASNAGIAATLLSFANATSLSVTNCTFVRHSGGSITAISCASGPTMGTGSVILRENIFYDCADPLATGSNLTRTVVANAYKPTVETDDTAPLPLSATPFASNPLLGDYYLNTVADAGASCRNHTGARTASAAGMTDP